MSEQSAFADLARSGGRGALVTVLEGAKPGAKLLVLADGSRSGSLGDEALESAAASHADELMWSERSERIVEDDTMLFVDVTFPPPRLIVFGAVDFAAALCRLAAAAGRRPLVVDPRARFAQPARFPDAEEVIAAWPEEAFKKLGGIDRATAIAVLTHDPKLDDAALVLALRSSAAYIGAMGSRRAQEKRRERLLAKGLDEADLARIAAPIGLDLGALTAEETALSIMGEIVALRNNRTGGRLSESKGRIHEVGAA
jgi:xanthine dehydrogenase accessory factor